MTVLSVPSWKPSTHHVIGDLVTPTVPTGAVFACIVAGTTSATEPAWPFAIGATVFEDVVHWQCVAIGFVDRAVAIAENVVRLYVMQQASPAPVPATPYVSGLLDALDGSDAFSHFSVIASATPSFGRDGRTARLSEPTYGLLGTEPGTVDVVLDRPLSPFPAQYRIEVDSFGFIASGQAAALPAFTVLPFAGVSAVLVPPATDTVAAAGRDFASPDTLADLASSGAVTAAAGKSALGALPIDDSGDYAMTQGLAAYKHRCLQRLITKESGFAHLPGYGVGVLQLGKRLQKASVRGAAAAKARAQILQEPETAEVKTSFIQSSANPGLVFLRVDSKTNSGQNVSFAVPFSAT